MTLTYPFTDQQYAELANFANQNGLVFDVKQNGDIELVTPAPIQEPPVSDMVLGLREKYKEATRSLCTIAGHAVSDKLEDTVYEHVLLDASMQDPVQSSLLAQTTMYCLMQLYRLDGNNAWDRI